MTKADLVALICGEGCPSKKEASAVVEQAFATITESLAKGDKVKISGFGTFTVCAKRARQGRNPQTGDPIVIEPRRVLSFKPSPVLKGRVDNGSKHRR